jgi:hypothetical protein
MATQTRSPASRKVSRVEPGRRRRKACTGRGISKHSGASGTGSVANFRIGIRRSHHQARSRQCVGLTGSALSGWTAKSKNRREPNWLQRPETHGLHFFAFFCAGGELATSWRRYALAGYGVYIATPRGAGRLCPQFSENRHHQSIKRLTRCAQRTHHKMAPAPRN